MHLALETLLGSISLLRRDHLDEAEAARLLSVGIAHDVALLDLAVLLEQPRDVLLGERGVNARHEQVGARVARAGVVVVVARRGRRATVQASVGLAPSCPQRRELLTGRRGHWERRCGRASRRDRDAASDSSHGRSHGARLGDASVSTALASEGDLVRRQ